MSQGEGGGPTPAGLQPAAPGRAPATAWLARQAHWVQFAPGTRKRWRPRGTRHRDHQLSGPVTLWVVSWEDTALPLAPRVSNPHEQPPRPPAPHRVQPPSHPPVRGLGGCSRGQRGPELPEERTQECGRRRITLAGAGVGGQGPGRPHRGQRAGLHPGLAGISVCVQARPGRMGCSGLGSRCGAFWVTEAWGTGIVSDSTNGTPRPTAPRLLSGELSPGLCAAAAGGRARPQLLVRSPPTRLWGEVCCQDPASGPGPLPSPDTCHTHGARWPVPLVCPPCWPRACGYV